MAVKILSDARDLPDEIIEEFNIDILPILVSKGEEYLDKVTLDPKKMYDDMKRVRCRLHNSAVCSTRSSKR